MSCFFSTPDPSFLKKENSWMNKKPCLNQYQEGKALLFKIL